MTPASRVPQVKGVSFQSVLTVVEKTRGAALVEAAYAHMTGELRDALRFGSIIAAGWYPVAWYRDLWQALMAASGAGDDFARVVGRASIDHDFNTIYRTLFRVLNPKTLVSIGVRHFSTIYDTGSVEVVEDRPTSVRLRWSGCVGFSHAMWIEILGSCERLAELAGGRQAHGLVHEGGGEGDERCVATISWH